MFPPPNSKNQAYPSYTNQEQYAIPPPPPFNSGWAQPSFSSSEPIPIQNPRLSQQQLQQQQQHVSLTFIDQTQKHTPYAFQPKNCFTQMCFTPPTPTSPASPTTPNSQYDAYKQSRKKPLKDALRSQIAKSRKRDSGGHFLPKGVCIQLERKQTLSIFIVFLPESESNQ